MRYNSELNSNLRFYKPLGTYEETKRLYPLVIAGDKQARQSMIVNNTPLALLVLKNFLKNWPQLKHLQDDLTGRAFLTLVECVNEFAVMNKPSDEEPGGYIVRSIQRTLQRAIKNTSLIMIPINSWDKPPSTGSCDFDEFVAPNTDTLELNELIASCCKTKREREIIALRQLSYTNVEIARKLETFRQAIDRVVNSIAERVEKKLKNN